MGPEKISKDLARFHPLYGLKGDLLLFSLLFGVQCLLLLYKLALSISFIHVQHNWTIQIYLFLQLGALGFAYYTLVLFLTFSRKFVRYFLIHMMCQLMLFLIPYIASKNLYLQNLSEHTLSTNLPSLFLLFFLPYVFNSQRMKITFTREMTDHDIALINQEINRRSLPSEKPQIVQTPLTSSDQISLVRKLTNIWSAFLDVIQLKSVGPENSQEIENEQISTSEFDYIPKINLTFKKSYVRQDKTISGKRKVTVKSHLIGLKVPDVKSSTVKSHIAISKKLLVPESYQSSFEQSKVLSRFFKSQHKNKVISYEHSLLNPNHSGDGPSVYNSKPEIKQMRKSEKRYGKNEAQQMLIKTYAHKPKTFSLFKPIRVFREELEERQANVQKTSPLKTYSSQLKAQSSSASGSRLRALSKRMIKQKK